MAESPRTYGCNVNLPKQLASGDLDLTATVVKTVTFKKADGSSSYAKKLVLGNMWMGAAPPVVEVQIHYRINSVDVDDTCYFLALGNNEYTVDIPVDSVSFYSTSSDVRVFIDAFGDEDLTGTIAA